MEKRTRDLQGISREREVAPATGHPGKMAASSLLVSVPTAASPPRAPPGELAGRGRGSSPGRGGRIWGFPKQRSALPALQGPELPPQRRPAPGLGWASKSRREAASPPAPGCHRDGILGLTGGAAALPVWRGAAGTAPTSNYTSKKKDPNDQGGGCPAPGLHRFNRAGPAQPARGSTRGGPRGPKAPCGKGREGGLGYGAASTGQLPHTGAPRHTLRPALAKPGPRQHPGAAGTRSRPVPEAPGAARAGGRIAACAQRAPIPPAPPGPGEAAPLRPEGP